MFPHSKKLVAKTIGQSFSEYIFSKELGESTPLAKRGFGTVPTQCPHSAHGVCKDSDHPFDATCRKSHKLERRYVYQASEELYRIVNGEFVRFTKSYSKLSPLYEFADFMPSDFEPWAKGSFTSHTILVVDCSGSMRKADVATDAEAGAPPISRAAAIRHVLQQTFLPDQA